MNENSNLTSALSRLMQLILVGVVFGLVVAFVAHFFVLGVQFFTNFRAVVAPIQISGFELHYAQFFTLGIVALCIIAIKKNLGIARWHGPADSIHAAHRTDNELDIKSGLSSTLVAFLSASGGASVGQYGPLVHFGAVIGSALKRFSRSGISTDIFIGCGVAAAISAGFNAPIAGVIFAHEAIIRHFSLKAIAPIAIASCVAAGVTELFWGGTTLFEIGGFDGDLSTLLPIALVLGPFFGVLAVGFMLSVRRVAAFTASGRFSPAQAVLIAAAITAAGGAFVPETLGLGGETVRGAIGMQYTLAFLFVVLFLKIILTSVCLGMGLFGGIFSPSLVIGAAGGAIALHILASLGLDLPGAVGIVICGIAAVSSSVIGAPIAGTIIILELTGSYEFALLAMISIVTSVLTSHLLFGNSFFDRQLLDRGIDISSGRTGLEMMERNIETIVHQDY
ncbi:MAG: chloride channel protein, partial [Rhodobacteraceae bacterium]|nr:chloride channel protein [Paracoccaceae bacterium]